MLSLLNLSCPLLLLPTEGTGVRLPENATRTRAAPLLCDSVQISCEPRLSGAVSFHTLSPRDVSLFSQGGLFYECTTDGQSWVLPPLLSVCLAAAPNKTSDPGGQQLSKYLFTQHQSLCSDKNAACSGSREGAAAATPVSLKPCSWDALPWDFVNSSPGLVPEGLLRGLEFLAGVVFSPGNPAIPRGLRTEKGIKKVSKPPFPTLPNGADGVEGTPDRAVCKAWSSVL